jgi:hypothetical protein
VSSNLQDVPLPSNLSAHQLFVRRFELKNKSAQQGSKAVLSLANIAEKEQQCITAVNYLFSLKINGVEITALDRRTFVLGFAAAVKSVFRVSGILLVRFPLYKIIETFQFSQDFLEVFFGIITSWRQQQPNILAI